LNNRAFIGTNVNGGMRTAAGYVSVWAAALIGFLTAIGVSLCQNVSDWIGIDEGLDVFKLHGIGGILGSFLTGIFASSSGTSPLVALFPSGCKLTM
jgi:ammonium transporter, Amt family